MTELTVRLAPQRRFEAIDVNARIAQDAGDVLRRHRRVMYCSMHTTAGFLDQSLSMRLGDSTDQFFESFNRLLPPDAEYHHEKLELRSERTADQRKIEPRNADSHLTFIGAGLRNCVTYRTAPDEPVYFIELDGKYEATYRQRTAAVLAYDQEHIVSRASVRIPVSKHPIDSVNLADARIGLLDQVNDLLAKSSLERGRVDLIVEASERN